MNPLIKIKQILATAILAAASFALPSHAMVVGPSAKPHTIVLPGKNGSPIIGSDFVIGPTTPGKWGSPVFGTGATVTWSLMPTGTSCSAEAPGCTITALGDFMPTGYLSAITAAFAAWSAVADIEFIQVADNGVPFDAPGTVADIRLGGHVFDGALGVLAHGYYPPENGDTAAGDIHFDIAELWKVGFGGAGFDIFQVTAHEIGHAIGLNHTPVPDSLMNPFYTEAFSGPQADDIAGAQFIYGEAHPVPAPGTLLLLSLGLLGLGAARRRA